MHCKDLNLIFKNTEYNLFDQFKRGFIQNPARPAQGLKRMIYIRQVRKTCGVNNSNNITHQLINLILAQASRIQQGGKGKACVGYALYFT
jgi:hypothetical protein